MPFDENYFASLAIDQVKRLELRKQLQTSSDADRLICFGLGDEEFGVSISFVQEIINIIPITPVPHAPEFIMGIINLRGEIYSVVDLGLITGMKPFPERKAAGNIFKDYSNEDALSTETAIIMLTIEDKTFGVLVDCVTGIVNEVDAAKTPPPAVLEDRTQQICKEVCRLDDRLIMVLDVRALIGCEELRRMEGEEQIIEGKAR